jgi:transposase
MMDAATFPARGWTPSLEDPATPVGSPNLPDEDACLDMLFRFNYSSLGACPGCHSTRSRFYRLRARRAYICQHCGHKIFPCANTFLHKSHTDLGKWIYALYLLSSTQGRITTRELGIRLQVTYKCAWRIRDRLSAALDAEQREAEVGAADHATLLRTFVGAVLPGGTTRDAT